MGSNDENDMRIERTRERRLRRRARRLGFVLNKRRGFGAYYGPNYWLLDEYGNPVLHDNGDPRNRAMRDDIEAHLAKVRGGEGVRLGRGNTGPLMTTSARGDE